jgi:methionyl-tRNA formyltransferase
MILPEVKQLALANNLRVLQPENLKDKRFLSELNELNADFFCVVAFRILPPEVYEMPPKGCVNLHASYLPRYRGAAPINWAIINGESETGVTTFFIRKKVDTGDIIMRRKIEIGPNETFGELHDCMADAGGDLLVETMNKVENGNYEMIAQDDSEATLAPKIFPDLGKIDWNGKAAEIHNLVRGLSPKPAAYTFFEGHKLSIIKSGIAEKDFKGGPGVIILADGKKGMVVACGDGALDLLRVKPASRNEMSGAEFVRGCRIESGMKFGEEFE